MINRKLLTLISSMLPLISMAVTFDVDGLRYEILSQTDKTVEVAIIPKSISYPSYSTYKGDYNIPASVDFNGVTYNVIGIGRNAFNECQSLGEITLPSSIQYIGFGAFAYSNLRELTLPNGILSIGAAAFRDCRNLTEFTIPESLIELESTVFYNCTQLQSVTILSRNLTNLPDDTFNNCISLNNFLIPDGITSIGSSVFMRTSSLENLSIPNSVSSIGMSCFYGSGITEIDIPDAVSELKGQMFRGCSKLQKIHLPANLSQLEKEMFRGCSSLETLSIPDGITIIPSYCFNYCTALNKVYLPETLVAIHDDAFSYCSSLSQIDFPEGLETISTQAFWGAKLANFTFPSTLKQVGGWAFGLGEISSLTLPAKLEKIGSYAFDDVTLTEVVTKNPIPVECEENVFKNETYYGTLIVPYESLDAYKSTKPWNNFFTIKGEDFSSIMPNVMDKTNLQVDHYVNSAGLSSSTPFNGFNIVVFEDGSYKKLFLNNK